MRGVNLTDLLPGRVGYISTCVFFRVFVAGTVPGGRTATAKSATRVHPTPQTSPCCRHTPLQCITRWRTSKITACHRALCHPQCLIPQIYRLHTLHKIPHSPNLSTRCRLQNLLPVNISFPLVRNSLRFVFRLFTLACSLQFTINSPLCKEVKLQLPALPLVGLFASTVGTPLGTNILKMSREAQNISRPVVHLVCHLTPQIKTLLTERSVVPVVLTQMTMRHLPVKAELLFLLRLIIPRAQPEHRGNYLNLFQNARGRKREHHH